MLLENLKRKFELRIPSNFSLVNSHVTLSNIIPFNMFLHVNFDKSTIELDDLFMLYILMKFQDDDLRLITIASIKGLNFKFLYLKLCMKDGLLS